MADGPVQQGKDGKITVEFHQNIALIRIQCGENRINPLFFKRLLEALDKVESNPNVQALITTGDGKFYSNGLDLPYIGHSVRNNPDFWKQFREGWSKTLKRIVTFPVPTIAALNGHAFAGGALLSLTHDYRLMRTGRGWFSVNEVHLGLPLAPALRLLVRHKLPSGPAVTDVAVMGKRFTAEEAHKLGIVQGCYDEKQLLPKAIEMARQLVRQRPYDRKSLHEMKCNMYEDFLNADFYGTGGGASLSRATLVSKM